MLCRSLRVISPSRIASPVIEGFFNIAIAIAIIVKMVQGFSSSAHCCYAV